MDARKLGPQLLATTAIEETWGIDEPVVFLGEWCRLYERRGVWTKRTHQVVRNHWDDRRKLRRDHEYLKELHDLLLADLVRAMNSYHQIERPLRYWQMILDPWLLTYVAVIWDRWECLRLAFQEHGHLETIARESSTGHEPCSDYNDFIEQILCDVWNHHICLKIIQSQYRDQCGITRVPMSTGAPGSTNPKPQSVKYRLAKFIDGLLGKLRARDRVVIFNTYFSSAALIGLNLNLKQLPRLYLNEFEWPIPIDCSTNFNDGKSKRDSLSITLTPRNAFEAFLLKQIIYDIPFVYLERFSWLHAKAHRLPMNPRVILTATAHWDNDLFKLWSAEQVLRGAKLITMEHGGSTPPAFGAMSFEEDISDIRAVWVATYHKKHRRLPPPKLVRIKSARRHLAIVGCEMPRYNFRAEAGPKVAQILDGFRMVCELYSLLTEEIKALFLVKPQVDRGWNIRQRYIDCLGAEKVSGEKHFLRFLSTARVIVCTYPQTTFAEAMASGVPSVLFYPAHLWEVIAEMTPLLENLRASRILFDDPQAAATHINSIWHNPDRWWNSPDVVCARNEFHRQALNIDTNWIKEWTAFIEGAMARA